MKYIYFILVFLLVGLSSCYIQIVENAEIITVADVGGKPDGVTVADSGDVYITDIDSGLIKKIDSDSTVTVIEDADSAVEIVEPDGITAVSLEDKDILYVSDAGPDRSPKITDGSIVKIEVNSDGTVITTEFVNDDKLVNPTGIVADNDGNLFVADEATGDIYFIAIKDEQPQDLISVTINLPDEVDLISPHGLTIVNNDDGSISLFTTDMDEESNNVVEIDIPADKDFSNIIAAEITPDSTGGSTTGITEKAKFNKPHGIATDGKGAIFVADENNNRVSIITPSGNVIDLVGDGTEGDIDGAVESATIKQPRGLATDADGDLLICDYGNGKVKKVKLKKSE